MSIQFITQQYADLSVENSKVADQTIEFGKLATASYTTDLSVSATATELATASAIKSYVGSQAAVAFGVVADETISIGDLIRFVISSDGGGLTPGRVIKCNATSLDNSAIIGVAISAGNQGDTISAVNTGNVKINFGSVQAASDNGKRIFLSTTTGQATITPPSSAGEAVIVLGRMYGANSSLSIVSCILDIKEATIL